MRYIVFSPEYNENYGGWIVLHKLCHILNEIGQEAYLYPIYSNIMVNKEKFFKPIKKLARDSIKSIFKPYPTNPNLNTPIFKGSRKDIDDSSVVIYPEKVMGNPLGAKNVVRWFLHKPGFFSKIICYGTGELYFDYNNFAVDFSLPGSRLSNLKLHVEHMPLDIYNTVAALPEAERTGSAYCMRKGAGRMIVHDIADSVLIDSMSHEEIAAIFKRVKTFFSYDPYTAYSCFAALCGTDVIIIPEEGVSKEQWYPDEEMRYGLAYGYGELDFARLTRKKLHERIVKSERNSYGLVKEFVQETKKYFTI